MLDTVASNGFFSPCRILSFEGKISGSWKYRCSLKQLTLPRISQKKEKGEVHYSF